MKAVGMAALRSLFSKIDLRAFPLRRISFQTPQICDRNFRQLQ